MKTYTVKEYAKLNKLSIGAARYRLTKMVRSGTATFNRGWQENPMKYLPAYSGLNLPGQWYNLYTIKD